jgi:hypothetical protein
VRIQALTMFYIFSTIFRRFFTSLLLLFFSTIFIRVLVES